MIKYTTNGFDGKILKMRKWQNKLNNESKTNKITTDLLNNRTGNTVEMTITNVLTQHTVVIVTKINVPEMIADDHPHEIAPTPTRAVRASQVITTETAHHSTMTKRNIRISQQHPTSRSTNEIQQLHAT
jgi:2,3-bisphosphoglycerate-independent phosphoglycerate mutase